MQESQELSQIRDQLAVMTREVQSLRSRARWAARLERCIGGAFGAALLCISTNAFSEDAATRASDMLGKLACNTGPGTGELFCFEASKPARARDVNANFRLLADFEIRLANQDKELLERVSRLEDLFNALDANVTLLSANSQQGGWNYQTEGNFLLPDGNKLVLPR